MAVKLKLWHKGLLILALPLCIQGISYIWLRQQISEVNARAKQQDVSKRIVTRVNVLILDSAKMFDVLVRYYLTREGTQQLNLLEEKSRQRVDELSRLLEQEAHDPEEAKKVRTLGAEFIKEIEAVKEGMNGEDRSGETSVAKEFSMSFRFRLATKRLCDELYALAAKQEKYVNTASAEEDAARNQIAHGLDLLVIADAILAAVLAFFFMRGTVSHLGVLKDNANRLASNQPLLRQIQSSDEVGEVDRVFHEMARALTAAANTLQTSEERLKSVIEALPVALVVTDENGKIESMNPTAELLFEYRSKKLLSKNIALILADKAKDNEPVPLIRRLLEESASRPVAMEGISSEQERIPVEVSVTSFEHSAGRRNLATIVDVTERYKLERLKRDFVAMVSHDIRTPLSSIRGILEITRDERLGPISDEAKQKLAMAEDNATSLLQMVKSLLDLEKLDAGLVEMSFREFTVQDLFSSAFSLVKQYAEEQSVVVELATTDLVVCGDLDSLNQVLTNLLSNAVRYSPPGGNVLVKASEQGDAVRIEVRDNGPGVPKRQQAEIFERFKQSNIRRDKSKGFGLGLAICKSIVTQHDQNIGVESENGNGSTFWFTIARTKN